MISKKQAECDGDNMTRKLTFKQKNYISAILLILIFSWITFINYTETSNLTIEMNLLKALFYVVFIRFAYWLIEKLKK